MRYYNLFSIGLMSFVVCLSAAGCSKSQEVAQGPEFAGIHTYKIDGLTVRTGDLICTNTGGQSLPGGLFWKFFGQLIYGDVDHIAVYVGPGGRCVEAGAKYRVVTFDVSENTWDAVKMTDTRGYILDNLYGVVYPLAGRSLTRKEEDRIRENVARYCLRQAEAKKLYNPIFTDSKTENSFYCSQLAYKAYLKEGIDLNTNKGVPDVPGTESIVFPQEIWMGFEHKKAAGFAESEEE
ncbi:MAG: hypothetical protein GWN67_14340 [Phycisphaerae bacterium]|nr:hypothetical protein [Phycisphaerae bacterium]NIP53312.1 hypothetical protein [Phycisphaerae bacterium]NIS49947.1 hypothetical protein [Phycisphaerae bacterium]NIU07651.1 hypothetical protein [Phycisphaerae bacterium]NIU57516.1 hypothetical protein [Phycisphaerae bacterium]